MKNLDEPEELEKHLPTDRIKMIKEGLTIPTYVMSIRKEGDTPFVDITRDGEEFMKSIKISSKEDLETAPNTQTASIVIESIFLLAQVLGIHLNISPGALQKLAVKLSAAIINLRHW